MKEVILITGANGLIAKQLANRLAPSYDIRFLTRNKKRENEFEWNIETGYLDEQSLIGIQHIIHLAGANIAEKRWTIKRKHEIVSSRVDSANLLLIGLKRNKIKLKTFISASAVGIYGAVSSEKIYHEEDKKGTDFISNVVLRWEEMADQFLVENCAERVVKLRTGVVLSAEGGAIAKMKLAIQWHLGAVLGNGKQYMPWIHLVDLCAMYAFSLTNTQLSGSYNAVSPHSCTNQELTIQLARMLKKPLLFPPIPTFVLKLLFGQAAILLVTGSRASADKISQAGFTFQYPELKNALEHLLSSSIRSF